MATKPATNGTTTTPALRPPAATKKSDLFNPTSRQPFRPPPYGGRNTRGRSQISCCRCCFWIALVIIVLLLIAATACTILYILYRPHRPEFSISSIRVHRLKLTTTPTAAGHLTTLMDLTITAYNPNKQLSFIYDTFSLSSLYSNVPLGNGTLPGFSEEKKSLKTLPKAVISGSTNLDAESMNSLKPVMNTKGGLSFKIVVDTKVTVKVGKVKLKKVGTRITCDDISATVPKGKSPTVAVTSGSKCKVDLRIKIWRFTF